MNLARHRTEGLTKRLGSWIASLACDDVPGPTREHLGICLLDTLGCGLFGSRKPWGRIASEVARDSAGGPCSLWGTQAFSGPSAAAMANGTSVHGFELDDVHLSGQIHPGAVTVPPVLALAEARGASGRSLLTALAVGYEVGIRFGVASGRGHGLSGFHPTGTIGAVAAAAASARLLELDPERCAAALALGATQAAGLYAARQGGMIKRFHAGHAAAAGVTAALLASRGFTATADTIEAPFGGLFSSFGFDGDSDAVLRGLGTDWLADGVGFKIYATCASAQSIVEGVRQLRARGLSEETLQELDIRVGSIAASNIGWPYRPRDTTAAQMNGSFAAAVALIDDDAFVDQFDDARLSAPDVLSVIERIRISEDPEIEKGGLGLRHASRITARLRDGSELSTYNEQRPGGPGREIGRDRVTDKFRRLAAPVVGEPGAERLIELTGTMDSLESVSSIAAVLAAPASTGREAG